MRVTVIPSDSAVYVDGVSRIVEMPPVDENWHSIQWYDTYGDIEVKLGSPLVTEDYAIVEPFVKAWESIPVVPAPQSMPAAGVEEM